MVRVIALSLMLFSLTACAAPTANAPKTASQRPEVGSVGKAFQGPEGLTLWTLRIGPESNQEVLLKYSNIDHRWNNKIFKAKIVNAGSGQDYQITVDGKPYVTVTYRSSGYGYHRYEVYLPQGPDGASIAYSAEESKKIVPQDLLNDYLKQEETKP